MTDAAPTAPRRGSLLVIFLTVFIDLLGFGIVLPLLPVYAKFFEVDQHGLLIGLLNASFSAMQFVFAPLWGRLSDRIGRRPVLMVGLAGSVIFYTMFGVATMTLSLFWLFVARIGAGVMGATISTAQAYIADSTSLEERPRGMALVGMAFGLGFTLGPLVAYFAILGQGADETPGPWPGFIAAGLSAVALVLAIFVLPESRDPTRAAGAGRHEFRWSGLRDALATPSIGAILLALFVCIFSFANFETTLSLLINEEAKDKVSFAVPSPFGFTFSQVCLTYALIGLVLAIVQGGVVRRLAGRLSEGTMAASGAVLQLVGFALIVAATNLGHTLLLLVALAIVVSGFAFMQPSLNSLLSRRSDPARQGSILGVGQSVSSLARILGAGLGVPLLGVMITLPFYVAATLMAVGLLLILSAARGGKDYAAR